jgi:hypothetical protein
MKKFFFFFIIIIIFLFYNYFKFEYIQVITLFIFTIKMILFVYFILGLFILFYFEMFVFYINTLTYILFDYLKFEFYFNEWKKWFLNKIDLKKEYHNSIMEQSHVYNFYLYNSVLQFDFLNVLKNFSLFSYKSFNNIENIERFFIDKSFRMELQDDIIDDFIFYYTEKEDIEKYFISYFNQYMEKLKKTSYLSQFSLNLKVKKKEQDLAKIEQDVEYTKDERIEEAFKEEDETDKDNQKKGKRDDSVKFIKKFFKNHKKLKDYLQEKDRREKKKLKESLKIKYKIAKRSKNLTEEEVEEKRIYEMLLKILDKKAKRTILEKRFYSDFVLSSVFDKEQSIVYEYLKMYDSFSNSSLRIIPFKYFYLELKHSIVYDMDFSNLDEFDESKNFIEYLSGNYLNKNINEILHLNQISNERSFYGFYTENSFEYKNKMYNYLKDDCSSKYEFFFWLWSVKRIYLSFFEKNQQKLQKDLTLQVQFGRFMFYELIKKTDQNPSKILVVRI